MTTIGDVGEFMPSEETWTSYVDRLETFMELNKIKGERKVLTLLTMIGRKTFGELTNLCTPHKPRSKTYEDLVEMMSEHVNPKPSFIAERYKFGERKQRENESVGQFLAQLKNLSIHCEYGDRLEEQLRDRLVGGIRNETIMKRLIAEKDLTYEKAVYLATSLEAADRDVKIWKNETEKESELQYMGKEEKNKEKWLPKPEKRTWENEICECCGRRNHSIMNCRYRNYKCFNCEKQGHLKPMCKEKKSVKAKVANNYVSEETLFNIGGTDNQPKTVNVMVDNIELLMEIDTGTALSLISDKVYYDRFSKKKLLPTNIVLRVYHGMRIIPMGKILVEVTYKNVEYKLELYVIENGGPSLLGRKWFDALELQLGKLALNNMSTENVLSKLKERFPQVFEKGLGTFKKGKFTLRLKEGAVPKFFKPRPIPFALKEKVELELERLVKQGVLTPVEINEWGTPIVPILKPGGAIRICGDYKVTLNQVLEVETFPLPRIEDLFATLRGGIKFSKIDLRDAYQQVELEEESKKLVTISTHKGLFKYNRIPFGVTSAPAKFQNVMEQVLQGLPGVTVFLDDLLVTGGDDTQHINRLEAVFERLKEAGLRVKEEKCELFKESVEYLGYKIDKEGLQTIGEKVQAIVEAPEPTNVKQLQSFIGMVNYYARFLKNLSMLLNPMYKLLQKDVPWNFDESCKKAFVEAKEKLISAGVLAHYDSNRKIRLACDASEYGLGAVISHVMDDGGERPIAYASRTLSRSERGYSQIDKEALALIFGIKRFNQYLYGRHFTLLTDHRPLMSIFGAKRGIPVMAANRMQRYVVFLAAYDYEIEYKPATKNANADCLSRLPVTNDQCDEEGEISYIYYVEQGQLPIRAEQIRRATRSDRILNKIKGYILHGWPEKPPQEEELKPYYRKKEQLILEHDCILWGYKVVIPTSLQKKILKELHGSHLGIVKMKSLARSYVWWPGLDHEIEQITKGCGSCLFEQPNPEKVKLHVWDLPEGPWKRIHVDFAGPFKNKLFLLVTDAYTKWVEVMEVSSTAAEQTIPKLRGLFARWGLPSHLVSDNGPPFTSGQIQEFLEMNGIKHILTPPYHPASNGLVENSVKTFKNKIKCIMKENGNLSQAINRYLLDYRNSIHGTTGESPAKLMLGRQLRSRLDLIRPDIRTRVQERQEKQVQNAKGKGERSLHEGEQVIVRDYTEKNRDNWIPGTIKSKLGPVTYQVQGSSDKCFKRHIDQVAKVKPVGEEKPMGKEPDEVQRIVEGGETEGQKEEAREKMRRYPLKERHKPVRLDL